jgi:5-methylcytosine-specific restriction endonuclease McrA
MKLLTRNCFRESVFKRDKNKCVICGSLAQDAHHIIDRKLFKDGGYYLDNGASLCGKCHLDAEKTKISPNQIRTAAKIKQIVLPAHLSVEFEYDKWGKIINTAISS